MPLPAERVRGVVGDVQNFLPDAIGGEVDISRHMRMSGGVRLMLRATVQPPMVEVSMVTSNVPSEERGRVLTSWTMRMSEPHASDPGAVPGTRVQTIQDYAMTPGTASFYSLDGTRQRITGEHYQPGVDRGDPLFVELAVAAVVSDILHERQPEAMRGAAEAA